MSDEERRQAVVRGVPREQRPPPDSSRAQTDESLRRERDRADNAIGREMATDDVIADEVIARARQRAEEVLAAARARIDAPQKFSSGGRAAPSLGRERAAEDRERHEQYAEADQEVIDERRERDRHRGTLEGERQETDENLVAERGRSDSGLAARDEFLAVVSHDLRNLLNTIVLHVRLIDQEVRHSPQRSQAEQLIGLTKNIEMASSRMNRLIGDLVDVASIEEGTLAVTLEVTDPAEVLMEAAEVFKSYAASKEIALSLEIPSPLPRTKLDEARILQVLSNLLGNAFKFTPAHGRIVVRANHVGSDIHVAVSDTGTGIPAERLEAIFGRFVQVGRDSRGVGLGLYISRCIVQGHGGRIWVESELGQGSTVHFTLPVPT